jgi:hypothetical protein
MGMGIKPNGLYYLLGFIVLILTPLFPVSNLQNIYRKKVIDLLTKIILPATIIGGFWYFRNLIMFGQLFKSELLSSGAKESILGSLANPDFYQENFSINLFYLISAIILLALIFICIKPRQFPLSLKLITGFALIAFIALIITPHSSGYPAGDRWVFKVQFRYAIGLIPITVILSIFFAVQLVEKLKYYSSLIIFYF